MPKDACYKKVKARDRGVPRADASGARAKCRKVGADKWGESSKRKRPVKKKLKNGGLIASGCGVVQESRRKETNLF